jgi:MFS family permease
MAWARNIWWVYALMIPQGLASGVFWPAVEASLADETPAQGLGRALGLFNITWSVGEIGGNLLGGAVTDRWPRSPFLLVAAIDAALAAAMFLAFGREGGRTGASGAAEPAAAADAEEQPPERVGRAYFRAALAANLAAVGAIVIMRGFFVEIAKDPELRYTGAQSSVALALTFVSQTAVFYVMGRTRFWRYRFAPLAVSQAALAAMCLYSAFSRSYAGLLAACAVAGACAGVPYGSSIFYALRNPAARGRSSGLHEGVLGIGSSLCPLLGGYVAELWAFPRGAYVFAPAVLAAAIVLQAAILLRRPPPGEPARLPAASAVKRELRGRPAPDIIRE